MAWQFTENETGSSVRLVIKSILPISENNIKVCFYVYKKTNTNTWSPVTSDDSFVDEAETYMTNLSLAWAEQV